MKTSIVPFGLLFEEQAAEGGDGYLQPIYDSEQGLSFIIDQEGQRKPYIDEVGNMMSTQSITHVATEGVDADPRIETGTATKIRAEGNDADYHM